MIRQPPRSTPLYSSATTCGARQPATTSTSRRSAQASRPRANASVPPSTQRPWQTCLPSTAPTCWPWPRTPAPRTRARSPADSARTCTTQVNTGSASSTPASSNPSAAAAWTSRSPTCVSTYASTPPGTRWRRGGAELSAAGGETSTSTPSTATSTPHCARPAAQHLTVAPPPPLSRLAPRSRPKRAGATAGWVDWYSNRRLHGTLGYVPPAEYEHAHYAALNREPQPA